ncbi:hypothetical protein TNCV_3935191 [Trichonephila clavipes]|nr:hypothetical protein TNCV_3935191 [Trichonephila clavipes]
MGIDRRRLSQPKISTVCGIAIKMNMHCYEDLVVDVPRVTTTIEESDLCLKSELISNRQLSLRPSGIVITRQTVYKWLHENHICAPSVLVPLMSSHRRAWLRLAIDPIHRTPKQWANVLCSPISFDFI